MLVDCLGVQTEATLTIGADQTLRNTDSQVAREFRGSSQPGSAGGVMSWSMASLVGAMYGAVAFKPSTAAGNPHYAYQQQ
jgi:hypothetical protein